MTAVSSIPRRARKLHGELREFNGCDVAAVAQSDEHDVPIYRGEFWTSKQRAGHRLHEISYRACFKPQLPRFFIERLTRPGEVVCDPFMGRGTTLLEAALLGRVPWGGDANPLCRKLVWPRLHPPSVEAVLVRLDEIDFSQATAAPDELLVFYHPQTLRQLCALRAYFLAKELKDGLDDVDEWIQMIALNRLTGHSRGFFSVYTLPPNQAVSVAAQQRINARLGQSPEFRSVPDLILAKTKKLLATLTAEERDVLHAATARARVMTAPCEALPHEAAGSVDLMVTSPPFLDVVNYTADNWLRCWFAGLPAQAAHMTTERHLAGWTDSMTRALSAMRRLLKPQGWLAMEVGEVRRGSVLLENAVLAAGRAAGLEPELVLINSQEFTKTANCWGVRNNKLGTNSNRVVLFKNLN